MPELLLGDAPPPPERRRRPRWVDGVGLGAIVVAMVAIGVLGDRGPREERADPTTTTTLRAPRRVPYSELTTTTSPTLAPPAELGALLPEPTATLLLLEGTGPPRLVDVDRGTVSAISNVTRGPSAVPVGTGFLLQDADDGTLVHLRAVEGGYVRTPLEALSGDVALFGDGRGGAWLDTPGSELLRVDSGGELTGDRWLRPPRAEVVGQVEQGFVVAQFGSLSLVDLGDGPVRSLGNGQVLGLGHRSLARLTCERLACRIDVVDTTTGRARTLAGIGEVAGASFARFSPDERWMVVRFFRPDGVPQRALIEVPTLTTSVVNDRDVEGPLAFGATSEVLFAVELGQLVAYDLGSDDRRVLEGIDAQFVHALTATAR